MLDEEKVEREEGEDVESDQDDVKREQSQNATVSSSVSQPGRDSDHEEGLVQEDEGAISTDGERDEDEEGTVEEEGVKSKVYSTAKEAEKVAIDEGEDHEQTERDLLQSPPEKSRRSERDGEEKPTEKISEKRKHSEDSEEEGEVKATKKNRQGRDQRKPDNLGRLKRETEGV
ncbi:hypothetical protein BSL78_16580 [Apostichopus japonicus]|uniref:Uncharacterized protein n=1 Tax=Stichopus japonicus TaxID=307972 RepID=A0A2G8KF03_STIJA|nr:hypothetical protein BSL78_16580 [Apostichopus japonicus]